MSTITAPDSRVPQAPLPPPHAQHVRRLGGYADRDAEQAREILGVPGPEGSTLVIDCLAGDLADARLVAHLCAEEPRENAHIISKLYLADETRGRCRRLTAQDLEGSDPRGSPKCVHAAPSHGTAVDAAGRLFRIRAIPGDESLTELRWTRSCYPGSEDAFEVLTLRDVVGCLEDYEPAHSITAHTLAVNSEDGPLSVCRLAAELKRLTCSAIVLNRGLREAVHREVARGELTLSEIAMRCGKTKRDRRGNVSGETSWLARRIGQLPEGGQDEPTPWVHSDVLALIAREGLGVSPREVEL